MNIKNVQLMTEVPGTKDAPAISIPKNRYYFIIEWEDNTASSVPNNPNNRHYWEIKDWYDTQKTKLFDFTFEEVPEPNFAETIYPEPEETEEPAEPEEVPEDEPKTLLPK